MEEDKIISFVRRKRPNAPKIKECEVKEVKLPWYKRPIEKGAFSIREGRDGKFYAQHKEWSKKIYIGPYASKKEVDSIIDDYVMESLKDSLDKKPIKSIHSICIEENDVDFFV